MQKFLTSYTKAVNKRFERVGSLFQGQFQAKPIQTYPHLLNLCVYIHANPVKDGLVALPEDWIYSNYLEWLGQRDGTLVDREFIQEHFGSPAEYQELVMYFVRTRYLPDAVRKYLRCLINPKILTPDFRSLRDFGSLFPRSFYAHHPRRFVPDG